MSEIISKRHFAFSIFIGNGKNFEHKNWFESKAPYVEVTIGDETKRTSKLSGLANPCWNETLKFDVKDCDELPSFIRFVVKDDRLLISSVELGDYTLNLDKDVLLKYQNQSEMTPFCTLYDGLINLKNTENAFINAKILYMCSDCNWLQKENETSLLTIEQEQQLNELSLEETKENKIYEKKEVHVLPTIHVQEKPTIIEKEVEYIKPVEIKQTIVHKEKPIIVEQPIIKEKNEHYRENANYVKNTHEIITENKQFEHGMSNMTQESLRNLKEQKLQEFNDITPIIQHEKEIVNLENDVRQKPTEIREKEVYYNQPIEIERTNIEKVLPKVREDVTIEKEHTFQKLPPEIVSNEPKVMIQDEQGGYSKEKNLNEQSQAM